MSGKITIWIALAALLLTSFSVTAQDKKGDDKAKEDEVRQKIAAFKKEISKAKGDDEIVLIIDKLSEIQHNKILAELKKFLNNGSDKVRSTAISNIGKYEQSKDAANALLGALDGNSKGVQIAILKALGDIKSESSVAGISNLIFMRGDTDISKTAINALVKIRSKFAIEPLIQLLGQLDAINDDPNAPPAIGNVSPKPSEEELKKMREAELRWKREMLEPTRGALNALTKQSFKRALEWDSWWQKNKNTFKVEK